MGGAAEGERRRAAREGFVRPALSNASSGAPPGAYLIGMLLCILAAIGVNIAAQGVAAAFNTDPDAHATRLAIALASLSAPLLALPLIMPRLHRRSFSTLLGAGQRLNWSALGAGALAALLATSVAIGVGGATGALIWTKPPTVALLLLIGLLVIGQATAEELVFRGYLLHALAPLQPLGPLWWAAGPTLLFALTHYSAAGGLASLLWPLAFGAGASLLVWRSGGLSAGIGFHIVHNWIALLLLGGATPTVPAIGPLHWRDGAPDAMLAMIGLGAMIVALAALTRWTPPEQPADE